VGDDWGLPTLSWTKQSYRPVKLLKKFVLRQKRAARSATGCAPASVTLRAARAQDIAATTRLEQACFDTYPLDAARLDYLYRTPRAVCRVAEHDGIVVGHAISIVRRTLQGGASGRLYSIAVDPACRGRGIGRQLLADAMAQLVARGVKRAYLEVERSNTAAVELYERNGFRAIESLPNFYGPNRDGVRMSCDLAADVLRPAA
jgi:ribosomal protein S18 acetylase RimI-like enzyme